MKNPNVQFLVGTSGWNYPQWRGVFYPEGLAQSKWFGHYTGFFPTVEVNATFYRFFKDSVYEKWRERAPEKFIYVLKAPRLITHLKRLIRVEEDIRSFWKSASILRDKLGLIFLQLAPNTKYDPPQLINALSAFPDARKVAVEFRSKEWLTDETKSLLRETGAVFCASDSPKSRITDWVTSKTAYIRLHGRKHWYADNYSDSELREIAKLARGMAARGAEKVYIFFNNDFEGYAVQNAMTLLKMLE
jgi:uncharacterized protein YecE (DUF72 family)